MSKSCSLKRLFVLGLGALVSTSPAARAIGPYVPDANTLHLWHLDESPAGTLPPITATESVHGLTWNLNVTNGAQLMATSYSGPLAGALNTQGTIAYGVLPGAFASNGFYNLSTDLTGASGSFTYEALIKPSFDPSTSLAGRTAPMEILSFDSDAGESTNRFFQFRLTPPASNEQWSVEFANIGSYTPAAGSNSWELSELVDDFSGDLSLYTSTVILDANGAGSNTAEWEINLLQELELVTSAYDGIEQYAMIQSGLTLEVGEELRVDIAHTGASQDIGLYVGGTTPVTGTRQDYVAVYARDQNTVYSRGFDGTGEFALAGGPTAATIEGVFIARIAENTYETGWYDATSRTIVATRTPVTPNSGDVVGFYADVRAPGTLGELDNLVKYIQTSTETSPEQFGETFRALLPVSGDNAAEQDSWYHVAVTYTGSEAATDNLKVYWTELSHGPTQASLLGAFTMSNDLGNAASILTGNFAVGNEGRGAPGENFVGLIDEVRVKSSALAANGFNLNGTPYSVDGTTLLLFHFNDTHDPLPESSIDIAFDEASANPLNLTAYDDPVFGTSAYTGFGSAVGFDKVNNPGNRLAVDESTALPMSNYVDAATGAFTFEAVIRPQWTGAQLAGEHLNIMTAEGDGDTIGRPFQFRVQDDGTTLRFDPIATRLNGGGTDIIDVPLPTTGTHALAAGEWYHLAITYTGNEGVSDNVTIYWTKLDSGAAEANVLATVTTAGDLINPTHLGEFCVGNELRNNGGFEVEEFIGTIDEVRISRIARAANDFVFSDSVAIDPFEITSITISGDNVVLTWESQTGVTYSILRKTALPGGSWATVKSGINSAGDGTTSDSVQASGSDEEFYAVEGE